MDYLIRDYIIETDDRERILAEVTQNDKTRALIDLLPRCGSEAFQSFRNALMETNQEFIEQTLMEQLCKLEDGVIS